MRQLLARILSWIGSHEVSVLLGFAAIVAGGWIFAELADQVVDGGTKGIDQKVLLAFRTPGTLQPVGSENVQVAARDLTALGGVVVLTLLTLFVAGFLALDGKSGMALFVCGSVASGVVLSTILKNVFQRPRPELVPHLQYVTNSSFPSGHSMMSAVTYLTLGALLARSQKSKVLKSFFLISAAFLTLAIGISRVYLGVHWPSDVLAGWIAGSVWAVCCWLVARRLQTRSAIEPEDQHFSSQNL